MALIPSFPSPFREDADVGVYNELLKTIFMQEHCLLNRPTANIYTYTFGSDGNDPIGVLRTLEESFEGVLVSIPNLDLEVVADSGGLILPTDRFMSAYDINPHILSVVEWPIGSTQLFTIQRKEYNAVSGRLELLLRQGNNLKGVIYGHVASSDFNPDTWAFDKSIDKTVITVNRSELNMIEQTIFAGSCVIGDIVFWALKESFEDFIPSTGDMILDTNHLGQTETYRVNGIQLDAGEGYYRLLCRRYGENA